MQINIEWSFCFELTSLAGSVSNIDRQSQSLILMPDTFTFFTRVTIYTLELS